MRLPKIPQFADPDTIRLIKRILAESLRPNWRSYAAAFLAMGCMAASISLTAWIMRDIVNQIFLEKNSGMLTLITVAVLGLFMMRGWSTYAQNVILARVGNRIVAANQQRIYDHLLSMDVGFFAKANSSDLITRLSYGANAARNIVDLIVQSLGRDLLTLLGLTAVMILQAPALSMLALLIGPFAIYGVTSLSRRMRTVAKAEMASMAEVVAVLQETAHGTRILKAYGLEGHMQARMDKAVRSIESRHNKMASLQARTAPLMDTLAGIAISAVVFISGWQAIYHGESPGAFMSFITALLLAYEPAKRLARVHVQLTASLIGARMMMELLDSASAPTETPGSPPIAFRDGSVEFRNVHFAYRPGTRILNDVSFVAKRGQRVALVGPTGAGKSTIFALVQRFYDVKKGMVAIDGQDLREVSSRSVREHIAYVSQDTYLFSGSVRDNIRLGRLTATDAEVEQAARDAYADEFIRDLAKGYDSTVGENGVQLSGGQRQRIAIARALLKDAPIVLLDEATSALDSETEQKIREAIDRLTAGRTTLVIAHRLSTVTDADWILVLENGSVVEEGTHRELLRRGGLYERLCKLQFTQGAEALAEAS